MAGCGEGAGAQDGAAAAGLEEGELVVPADGVGGAGLTDEVEDVGAAAEDDVLGVDGLVEGGVVVGVGSTANVGTAFEESDLGPGAGEGERRQRGRLRLLLR